MSDSKAAKAQQQTAPIDMTPEEFRGAGHRLVEEIAGLLEAIPQGPITPAEPPEAVRRALGNGRLPDLGAPAEALLVEVARLLREHSLFSGHPRFMGYVNSSGAPIGALADLLAAAVNPNVGGWNLSPVASEIEAQTVRWIAELLGYPADCGGLLVSGGNMANFIPFLAARKAKADWNLSAEGLQAAGARPLRVYCSEETHTWIHKAADLFGLGTEAIRWIPTNSEFRMDTQALRECVARDRTRGDLPFLVVGAAGSVATGAVDPLAEIAGIARDQNLWFHVDGAYGAVAAALADAPADLKALALADSVAVDPHKWLYAPLEAGCALVRDREALRRAFSYRPSYYHFNQHDGEVLNYFEYGMQNSRGFRALKVWVGLRQAGREGYARMISENVRLAEALYQAVAAHPEYEAFTRSLSIATFRYVPRDLRGQASAEEYLNRLNAEVLERIKAGGEVFLTNAVLRGKFVLRACIVNFRTRLEDVEAVPEIVARVGRETDREMRARN